MKPKIKIFRSKLGFDNLETQINEWIENQDVEIINIAMADNADYCSALVMYKIKGEYIEA